MVRELKGVLPILATPCEKDGSPDFESLRKEIDFCLENGVNGFTIGNCSDIYAFSHSVRNKIVETVVDAANGKAAVLAGAFASTTGDAVELSKDAEDLGADAIFMFGPLLLSGQGHRQGGVDIVEHYKRIDRAVNIPICAYNTPVGAPGVMRPEKILEILEACPGIEYLKTGEPTIPQYIRTIRSGVEDKVKILSGKSHMNFRFLAANPKTVGVTGCIAAVLPAEHVEMWNYFVKGDIDKARVTWIRKILPLVDLMFIGGALNIRKEALYQMGVFKSANPVTPYATGVTDDFHKKELTAVLKLLGKL